MRIEPVAARDVPYALPLKRALERLSVRPRKRAQTEAHAVNGGGRGDKNLGGFRFTTCKLQFDGAR